MLRRKVSFGNVTRYLFCAERLEEEDVYKDDYLAQNLDIESLSKLTAVIFVTENSEAETVNKTQEYLLNKRYAEKSYKKLTEYSANKNKEKVTLYYKTEKAESITDILPQCGQGNLVILLKEDATAAVLNKFSEMFSQEQYILSYESYGDRIFALYNKLAEINSVKYILHYTMQCHSGADGLADISIPVNSFDVVETNI